ncbi:unnamed protein product [Penicillium salamii]|nr:unnamed protein product [Penicillium salamii]CAG8375638.1 unnamed protein product [Penicillium salamii]
MLLKVAKSPNAGEIMCIIDALDECEKTELHQLSQALEEFYCGHHESSSLKFLVTSRPYTHIQRGFRYLENRTPKIHLSGEDDIETEKIAGEINLVIQARVEEMGVRQELEGSEQKFLHEQLVKIPHRTYLWVTLIFDVIENSISYTKTKLREIIDTIPRTVDEAYETILERSPDPAKARKLLHIVVSAAEPITVEQMRVALAIEPTHRAFADLDLESVTRFPTMMRNLCGLFVTIIDSKVYLLHQTAKEFLVQRTEHTTTIALTGQPQPYPDDPPSGWKHSLAPPGSNQVMADICITYLLLDDFETDPKILEDWERGGKDFRHCILLYTAIYWENHFRNATMEGQLSNSQSVMKLRGENFRQFNIWIEALQIAYRDYSDEPASKLWVATRHGLESLVGSLLCGISSQDLCRRCSISDKSALTIAVESGRDEIVNLLLDAGSGGQLSDLWIEGSDKKYEPLESAASHDHLQIAILILERDRDFFRTMKPSIPEHGVLWWWAIRKGYTRVVSLMLEEFEADATTDLRRALSQAVEHGHMDIVKLLLQKGVDPMSKDPGDDSTLLHTAARKNHPMLVELFLGIEGVDTNHQDIRGHTPFYRSLFHPDLKIAKLLLATNSIRMNKELLSALSATADKSFCELLLANAPHAVDWPLPEYYPPIYCAVKLGDFDILKSLLNTGVDPNVYIGPEIDTRTPISIAAKLGHFELVQLLLQFSVYLGVYSKMSRYKKTSRQWALEGGHPEVAHLIQKEEIRRAMEGEEIPKPGKDYDDLPDRRMNDDDDFRVDFYGARLSIR